MMGRVSEVRRQQIMKLLQALLENDAETLCAILLQWAGREGDDPGELTGAVSDFLGEYAGKSLRLTDLSAMVGALLALVRDNNLSMPPDQAMLLKVFVSLEGAFKKLDPEFDIMVAIQPTLEEAVTDQLSPGALGKRALKIATQYAELFADLPKEVRRGIYSVKTGNLKIRVELSQLEQLQRATMRGVRVLALASLASAVVIGGAIVMVLRQKPKG
jgi:ubiquinone biosynthesis protein